jgi:hypothetical protein
MSAHVVRAVWREVECSSTTSLPDLLRADNVLRPTPKPVNRKLFSPRSEAWISGLAGGADS